MSASDGRTVTPRGHRILPESIEWQATRSGGPGGQHANTSDTAVTVTVHVERTGLAPHLVAPQVHRLTRRQAEAAIDRVDLFLGILGHIAFRQTAARHMQAAPVLALVDDEAGAREAAGERFAGYGFLPSYRAMLDREGVEGPADVAIIGRSPNA